MKRNSTKTLLRKATKTKAAIKTNASYLLLHYLFVILICYWVSMKKKYEKFLLIFNNFNILFIYFLFPYYQYSSVTMECICLHVQRKNIYAIEWPLTPVMSTGIDKYDVASLRAQHTYIRVAAYLCDGCFWILCINLTVPL